MVPGSGWLGALVWALGAVHISIVVGGSHGGASGLNLFADETKAVRLIGLPMSSAVRSEVVTAPTPSDAMAEIEPLIALRVAGYLSEAEFADLKADVLWRMRALRSG